MGFSLPIDGKRIRLNATVPLLPLRDTTLFPGSRLPLFIGRPGSVAAVTRAEEGRKIVLAVAQKKPEVSAPRQGDLYEVGVLGALRQIIRLPDGTMRILLQGIRRARVLRLTEEDGSLLAAYTPDPIEPTTRRGTPRSEPSDTVRALQQARTIFLDYARHESRITQEDLMRCLSEKDPESASYLMAGYLVIKLTARQELLEAPSVRHRLELLVRLIGDELEEPRWTRRHAPSAPPLRVQEPNMKGGEPRPRRRAEDRDGDETEAELAELTQTLERTWMPPAVQERARRELSRLSKMAFLSPEATVARSYLDWLLALPWRRRSRDRRDLSRAQAILDEEHYGLSPVKDRVLEQIAVMKLSRRVRGPILCLSGPPGVGKTSLGPSIARAMNRRFVRMSLGGVRDEAEIRGHRRTYIGALPGRIIQAMKRAGTVNPVILLDEVDKLGVDYRGDPAAALLEVLDPEQNRAFSDHYLEVDYDLSQVLFVTTANNPSGIPPALRDRMEVIPLPGYLETEKLAIAERYLLPRQRAAAGLKPADLEIPAVTLGRIIREYTREAGVRSLEREIARICRRVARGKAGATAASAITPPRVIEGEILDAMLGAPHYSPSSVIRRDRVGIATALAWSETGGTILQIEVGVLPGRGRLILTGRLGSTLRESAQAALSCVRSRTEQLGLERDFYRSVDIHLHIPEGEVPKDGPSAGAAIALAMVSALTLQPSLESVAITGELTLSGRILPIGGLNEKLLAALRAGAHTVLIPAENQRQLADVPAEIRTALEVVPVTRIDQVIQLALSARLGTTVRRREKRKIDRLSSGRAVPAIARGATRAA